MPVYAKGRKSVAISDRSGFRVPYKNLRTEWNGSRVAPDEYEEKHPQLTPPKNVIDATTLFKPRPDNDPENISIFIGYNWFNTNETTLDSTKYEKPNDLSSRGTVGFVKVETPVEVDVSSVHDQGVIGTAVIETSITETGVAGTGAVGTETVEVTLTETGVAGTGATGTESVDVDNPYWGHGTWGNGSWGQ